MKSLLTILARGKLVCRCLPQLSFCLLVRGRQVAYVEELVRLWLLSLLDHELPALLFGRRRALEGEKALLLFLHSSVGLLLDFALLAVVDVDVVGVAVTLLDRLLYLAVFEGAHHRVCLSSLAAAAVILLRQTRTEHSDRID